MKLIIFMMMSVFTLSVHAEARLPTLDEVKNIISLLDSNNSIRPLINDIKNKKLNPFYEKYGDIISRDGRSALFHTLIEKRFDLNSKNKGSLDENIELLETIIQMGLNLNIEQPINLTGKKDSLPITLVSNNCSLELFKLFTDYGADSELDNTLFFNSLYHSADENLDLKIRNNCNLLAEYFLSNSVSLDARSIYVFYGMNNDKVNFAGGESIRSYTSDNILNIFKNKYSVKFSNEPSSKIPTDEWYEEFLEHLSRPSVNYFLINGVKHEDLASAWWNNQSEDLKKWACYYSSFDEVVSMLINGAGKDESWLASRPKTPLEAAEFRSYGEFAIKTFVPFCQSIK